MTGASGVGRRRDERHRDVIVVGSGFGGALAAWPLVERGLDVLMLERGARVRRGPHNWEPQGTVMRAAAYTEGPSFSAETRRGRKTGHAYACVGGGSVYYGGVSLRFREEDFRPDPEIVTDSGARWPFAYDELAPYYDRVERILGISGQAGDDPTEPPRSGEYPYAPGELSPVSRAMADAARRRGLRPFRLPLAINYNGDNGRARCIECATCDTFACAIGAKNDVDVQVLMTLENLGLELRSGTSVTGLLLDGRRVRGVSCFDRESGATWEATADRVVLAGGALGSAQLLLASGIDEFSPAGDVIGRYLTRHCAGIVFGGYTWVHRHEGRFHKQIGINDFYHGDPTGQGPRGTLGNIQQTQTPAMGTVRDELGPLTSALISPLVRRATGLLVIAEDRPKAHNRVTVDRGTTDEHGLPKLHIEHRYDARDLEAREFLIRQSKALHREAGALATYLHVIDTFSHALGTVRMGDDPERAPLDAGGRVRGVEGLYVADGSTLPTSAGVNPSLTIAANALRIGERLVREPTGPGSGS